jgi:hypothetical protein
MAEIDRFERSLAGAFLRLADDVAGDVDAAAVARRVALEHPRRPGVAGRLRLVDVPRLAWVLVLLGALLAALVGGTLLVGSQLERRLPAVVPNLGPVATCPPGSMPDRPGPADQVRPPTDGKTMAFDRRAGRIVAVMSAGNSVETWTFDVCTNTWTEMHPDRVPSSSEWTQLVYDVDSDRTLLVSSGRVWAYDLQADTWAEKRVAPTGASFIAYDPVSGLVVAEGGADPSAPLSTYDVETDTWTPIHQANEGPDTGAITEDGQPVYGPFAYDASVDRMVVAGGPLGTETWLFDLRTGSWSAAGAEAPAVIEVFATAPTIVYDEAAERTVLIGDVARLAAYDATADRWEILAGADPERAVGFQLKAVYDPVNRRLVGWQPSYMDQDDLFAFDLVTRRWTVLLEPSSG